MMTMRLLRHGPSVSSFSCNTQASVTGHLRHTGISHSTTVAGPASSATSSCTFKQLIHHANRNTLLAASSTSSAENAGGYETDSDDPDLVRGPQASVTRPLPKVLLIHTGGTLGMDPQDSFEPDEHGKVKLKAGTGGSYRGGLKPGNMLSSLLNVVPELSKFANLDLKVAFNMDSSRVGLEEWVTLAKILDANRKQYDAFLVVSGTDTLAFTASALSLMLSNFRKPVLMTGSQLPLALPRSDARQNLIDSLTVAVDAPPHNRLQEVAICFGGKLLRGNRSQKVHASSYRAFGSPSYPELATLGVDVDWHPDTLLQPRGQYAPRFTLDPAVIRIPIVPGTSPRQQYGDVAARGIKGIVLEAFGVGNMPDAEHHEWLPWLREQRGNGVQCWLSSQCLRGALQPELYQSGSIAMAMGVEVGPLMTPECAVVKMMLCLAAPDLRMGVPIAGEM